MTLSFAKKRSLLGCLFVFSGAIAGGALVLMVGQTAGILLGAGLILSGWWIILSIRCGHCGARLLRYRPFKTGGAILLWGAKEPCPKCRRAL